MAGVQIIIQGDGESARKALEMVNEHLHHTADQAEHESERMREAMESVKKAFELVGVGLGLREGIEVMKEAIEQSLEFGEAIEKASKKTGLAAGTLSTLHYAAAITGSDFDGLTAAVSKMDKTIGAATSGDKKSLAYLNSLGLNAKALAERSDGAEVAFKKFAQTLAATENPIRRVQLATGLLGKAGAEQIPMLLEVGENWEEFTRRAKEAGVYLDSEGAESLAQTNQKLHDMQQRAQGAALAFTEGMVPGLNSLFGTLTGGESSEEGFKQFGKDAAKLLTMMAAGAYTAASAWNALWAAVEGGDLTQQGAKDKADAHKYGQRAEELTKMVNDDSLYTQHAPDGATVVGPYESKKAHDEAERRKKEGGGFEGVGDLTKVKPEKSDDPIERARTALADEAAKFRSSAQRVNDQLNLAELETQHKLLLISDQEYFAEKLRLQNDELDAEQTALEAKGKNLQELLAKQHGDKLLKRDKNGDSAEELRTQRELVLVGEQLNQVTARRGQASAANVSETTIAQRKTELEALRLAADLEKDRTAGLTAQIALLERETELEAEKIKNAGGSDADVANVRALGDVAAAKLKIAEVNRQITSTEADYRRAVDELNDAATKDPRLKRAAEKQITALNQQEAASLRDLVQQYDALAAVLGGEYIETARNLHAELDKLNRPDNRENAAFAKAVTDGVTGMANKIAEETEAGTTSFKKMVKDMERDALALALKLAEQKYLQPFLDSAAGPLPKPQVGGGIGSQAAALAMGAGPQVLKAPAASGGGLGGLLSGIFGGGAKKGDGAGAMKVKLVVENQTGQPVALSQQGEPSFDGEELIVSTILKNMSQGGSLSFLSRG